MSWVSWVLLGVAVVLGGGLAVSVRRDPRWAGNAFLLSGSVVVALAAALTSSAERGGMPGSDTVALLAVAVVVLSPLLVATLVGFLLLNGVAMLRKEGRSLGNLLSLLAGLGLVGVVLAGLGCVLAVREAPLLLPAGMMLLLGTAWAGFVFVSYLAWTLVYPRLVRRGDARYVVVHGSGLIGGRVPPLLRARVDAGIRLWRDLAERDPGARLVLSGGQGADETRSEASAMAEYAADQGVPGSALLLEDTSRTTAENLRLSRELVGRELGPGASGLAVTSSYHVLRTASLARAVGIDAQVQPAPVAGYFWPSAFLREFVALVMAHRVGHLLAAALVVLPLPLAFAWAIAS